MAHPNVLHRYATINGTQHTVSIIKTKTGWIAVIIRPGKPPVRLVGDTWVTGVVGDTFGDMFETWQEAEQAAVFMETKL